MSTLVIKDLPEDLLARLKKQAQRNHRSVTKEVVSLIDSGLAARRQPPKLSPPLQLRSGHMLTIEDIEAAIGEGRD